MYIFEFEAPGIYYRKTAQPIHCFQKEWLYTVGIFHHCSMSLFPVIYVSLTFATDETCS